ncbi:MAG: hypothetical protein KF893_08425 [Caldilineaceae bacterium]|nr:hypothetical protein [Caldilineaceae bacterium]
MDLLRHVRMWMLIGILVVAVAACTLPTERWGESSREVVIIPTPASMARQLMPTFTPTPTPLPNTPTATPEATPSPTLEATPSLTPLPPVMAAALPDTLQNFEQIGHTSLDAIGWHGGLALADRCAYVGNRRSGHIAIVDITNPAQPTPIGRIPIGRNTEPVELRTIPARNLLVVADVVAAPHLRTFDITDCANPQPLASMTLPAPAHEFYLWQGGERVLFFAATFGGPPDMVVVDLTYPAAPYEVARWSARDIGLPGRLHSLTVSPSADLAYLALWDGGFAMAQLDLPQVHVLGKGEIGAPIFWFPNTHSALPLTDPRYVLLTSEIYKCPFGAMLIVDVADPAAPQVISSFSLPENRCDNLPAADAVFTAHNPLLVGDLLFVSWYAGGLQVLDVSDPAHPQRVGQFLPGRAGAAAQSYVGRYPVQTWSYPILREGLLYVVDIQSGLHVVRYTGPKAEGLAGVAHLESNVTMQP